MNYKCSYCNFSMLKPSNLVKHEKYVPLILRIRRNVSDVIKCFIHMMTYLNIPGHVESICVFNVMFHFYLQRH